METKENILKTIETLKEEISSLQSNKDAEKLLQIAHIVECWFIDTSCFDMENSSRPGYARIKDSICNETINSIAEKFFNTYNAFYDIVEIIDILH